MINIHFKAPAANIILKLYSPISIFNKTQLYIILALEWTWITILMNVTVTTIEGAIHYLASCNEGWTSGELEQGELFLLLVVIYVFI